MFEVLQVIASKANRLSAWKLGPVAAKQPGNFTTETYQEIASCFCAHFVEIWYCAAHTGGRDGNVLLVGTMMLASAPSDALRVACVEEVE